MNALRHAPSRSLRAAAHFGLSLDRADPDRAAALRRAARTAMLLHTTLHVGQVALLTGPSGSGKSTILRAFAPLTTCLIPQPVDTLPTPIAERSPLPLTHWLALLARLGLAEAPLLLRPPSTLSTGQAARFALALAVAEAFSRSPARSLTHTLLIDEFLAPLDRPAARSAAYAIARLVRTQPHLRLVAATSHTDLTIPLNPDKHLDLSC